MYATRDKKLGQMLVERGWITGEQLIRAIQSQRMVGGRLGTCLLEMDVLDEDTLLDALSAQLSVPSVSVERLRYIDEQHLQLVPAKVASRCLAVPFASNDTEVQVATLSVRNLGFLDELAFCTERKVVPHIANEVRIYEALEKYYGYELPKRYGHLLDRLNRSRYLWDESAKILLQGDSRQMAWSSLEDAFGTGDHPDPVPGLMQAASAHSHRPPEGTGTLPFAPPTTTPPATTPPATTPPAATLPATTPPAATLPAAQADTAAQATTVDPTFAAAPSSMAPASTAPASTAPAIAAPAIAPPESTARAISPASSDRAASSAAASPVPAALPGAGTAVAHAAAQRQAEVVEPSPGDDGSPPLGPRSIEPARQDRQPVAEGAPSVRAPEEGEGGEPESAEAEAEPRAETLEDVDRLLGESSNPHEIAEVMLRFAGRTFERVALFSAKPEPGGLRLRGWKIRGEGVDEVLFSSFEVGPGESSMFAEVGPETPWRVGPMAPSPIHRKLASCWGGEFPAACLLVPVSMRGRTACLLYGDRGPDGLEAIDPNDFRRLALKAAMAFELCILRKKIQDV